MRLRGADTEGENKPEKDEHGTASSDCLSSWSSNSREPVGIEVNESTEYIPGETERDGEGNDTGRACGVGIGACACVPRVGENSTAEVGRDLLGRMAV